MAAQQEQSESTVRCCVVLVGLGPQRGIDAFLAKNEVRTIGSAVRLDEQALPLLLKLFSEADVCLLVYTTAVSPKDVELLERMGILDPGFDEYTGCVLHVRGSRIPFDLPEQLRRFQFANLDEMDQLRGAISAQMREVRAGRRPPLAEFVPIMRKRLERAEPGSDVPNEPAEVPEAANAPAAPVAQALSNAAEPRDIPLPASGPVVYLSYAYEASTEEQILELARELRRAGVRAQIDRLGFLDEAPDRTAEERYRRAVESSEWYVLLMTDHYLARGALSGWTGVKADLLNIEAQVLRDPFARERLLPVVVFDYSSPKETRHPRVALGLDWLSLPKLDPPIAVGVIQRAMRDHAKAQTQPVAPAPIVAAPQSPLVQAILQDAEWIARGSVRELTRVPVGALVLAMLNVGAARADAGHSAAWLAEGIGAQRDGVARLAGQYFPNWPVAEFGSGRSPKQTLALPLSYNVYSLLLWACLLAERTGGDSTKGAVRGAHVLTALLHRRAPWTEAAEKAFGVIGLDPAALRQRLSRDLPTWGLEGDAALWRLWDTGGARQDGRGDGAGGRRASRGWRASAGAASVSADDPRFGDDQLDITPDVEAFAKVLASWNLEPPLALGLFGDWGSGKTFFMKRLRERIEEHSRDAREGANKARPQNALAYCKYIVQVEFNAWHYSEGDLWACLVDHIFTNLRLTDKDSETEVARRRKAMLTQMQALQVAGDTAEQRQKQSQQAIDEAQNQLNAARRRLQEAQNRFTKLSVSDIWRTVSQDPRLQVQIRRQLISLGFNKKNMGNLEEIRGAIEDARSVGGRMRETLRFLWSQRDNPYAWLAFALVFAVPPAVLLINRWFGGVATQVGTIVTAVISAAAGLLPTYRALAAHATHVMDVLDKPRRMAEEAKNHELRVVQDEITRLTQERNAAEQRQKDIQQQKTGLQKRIDELNADRMLADFLQDRAASDDYRKKLGTLALIRRDFERLADLMRSQREDEKNWKEEEHKAAPGADEKGAKPEEIPDELRVNRIVLYIDDLDRCGPKQVVDVLQAIHLLLAFPLFVVVVGVDARWVYRSIRVRSRHLLRADRTDEPGKDAAAEDVDTTDMPGLATPHDYLEKIFQVPFWLQPMGEEACKKLIAGIVQPGGAKGGGAAKTGAEQPAPAPGGAGNPPTPQGSAPAAVAPAPAPAAAPGPPTSAPQANVVETKPVEPGPSKPAQTAEAKPPETAKPRSLELERVEIEWMQELAPLVARSPRAVKRFVNCYRLFKAVLPEEEVDSFVKQEPGGSTSPAQAALFFLALIVGAPEVAGEVLGELQAAPAEEKLASAHARLSESLGWDATSAEPHLRRVGAAFAKVVEGMGGTEVGDIRWIADRALRFSFRSTTMNDGDGGAAEAQGSGGSAPRVVASKKRPGVSA